MSLKSRQERFKASRLARFRRYSLYAVGEVILIFVGITLALAFSNWNEEQKLHRLELLTLADITSNLETNVEYFKSTIENDTRHIAACQQILETVSNRDPWTDSLANVLYLCRGWTSPFIVSSAYEAMKLGGTELIEDRELRNSIVALYEQEYAYLVYDTDKSFWVFHSYVIIPMFKKYVRELGVGRYVPSDYTAMLDASEFVNFLYAKINNQEMSVADQRRALDETEKIIKAIATRLPQSAP